MDIELEYNSTGSVVGANFYPSYNPSPVAAWLFVALFALVTVIHFVLVFTWRSKFFLFLILGGIMEVFGYYGRAWSHDQTHQFGPWALQLFLIMCAPPLISASVYLSLGRVIQCLDARSNAAISPRISTPILVLSDIIALISQLAGIGLQAAQDAETQAKGVKITLAGLIFQLVLSILFIASIVVFHRRTLRNPTRTSAMPELPWTRVLIALYIASGAILLRNTVRLAEYAQQRGGLVAEYEVFIYLFDALPMWLAMAVLAVWHSGHLRLRAKKIRLRDVSDTELVFTK